MKQFQHRTLRFDVGTLSKGLASENSAPIRLRLSSLCPIADNPGFSVSNLLNLQPFFYSWYPFTRPSMTLCRMGFRPSLNELRA
jgi:hypothetical protein